MKIWSKKWAAVAIAIIAPLSLSGCLILPGEFTSEMTVQRTGDFSFSYKGQIQLIGLASILNSEMMNEAGKAEFKATCYKDSSDQMEFDADAEASPGDTAMLEPEAVYAIMRGPRPGAEQIAQEDEKTAAEAATAAADAAAAESWQMEERECTADEVATQKKEWDDQQVAAKKREEENKKIAKMMLGGVDPKDPKTVERFTKEVERLAAWNKVEHLGHGVFMVDYSTKGKLADDFAFPVIPRYAVGEPMIHVTRWDNGRLRVEAPAFKTDPEMSMMSMFSAGAMMGMMGNGGGDKMPEPVTIKGSFTLTTDAPILANNSEDGPEQSGAMQVLRWDIGPANYGAPMALLKLAQ